MGNAIRATGINVLPGINVRPLTDRDAADLFQPVVLKIETGRLAQAAHRSKDAAKRWKQGRQCPSGASLINMARALPAVQQWLAEESGYGNRAAQAQSADEIKRAIYSLAAGQGPDALWAQKQIALMNRGDDEPAPKPEERDTRTISFMDRLQRRRA